MFAFSGLIAFLFFDISSPADENSRSTGTDVAGIERYCFDNDASVGYRVPFFYQNARGSTSRS